MNSHRNRLPRWPGPACKLESGRGGEGTCLGGVRGGGRKLHFQLVSL